MPPSPASFGGGGNPFGNGHPNPFAQPSSNPFVGGGSTQQFGGGFGMQPAQHQNLAPNETMIGGDKFIVSGGLRKSANQHYGGEPAVSADSLVGLWVRSDNKHFFRIKDARMSSEGMMVHADTGETFNYKLLDENQYMRVSPNPNTPHALVQNLNGRLNIDAVNELNMSPKNKKNKPANDAYMYDFGNPQQVSTYDEILNTPNVNSNEYLNNLESQTMNSINPFPNSNPQPNQGLGYSNNQQPLQNPNRMNEQQMQQYQQQRIQQLQQNEQQPAYPNRDAPAQPSTQPNGQYNAQQQQMQQQQLQNRQLLINMFKRQEAKTTFKLPIDLPIDHNFYNMLCSMQLDDLREISEVLVQHVLNNSDMVGMIHAALAERFLQNTAPSATGFNETTE